jgi:hypothetical protein
MFLKLIISKYNKERGGGSKLGVMEEKFWKCWILLICIHKKSLRSFRENLSKIAFELAELEQNFREVSDSRL